MSMDRLATIAVSAGDPSQKRQLYDLLRDVVIPSSTHSTCNLQIRTRLVFLVSDTERALELARQLGFAVAPTAKLIMPVVLLMRVIERAGPGTSDGADASAFASSGQCADRCSASRTNAHALCRVYVTFVPNVLLIGAVVSRSRKVSRRRSKKQAH